MRSLTFWMTSSNLVSSVLSMGYWGVEATSEPENKNQKYLTRKHFSGFIHCSLTNDSCWAHTGPTESYGALCTFQHLLRTREGRCQILTQTPRHESQTLHCIGKIFDGSNVGTSERNKETFSFLRIVPMETFPSDSPLAQRYSGPWHSAWLTWPQLSASSHRISPFLHSHSLHRLWVNTSSPWKTSFQIIYLCGFRVYFNFW